MGSFRNLCLAVSAGVLLAGCGGGAASQPINAAPTANAGSPQTVTAGTIVSLNGVASSDPEKSALSYMWQMTGRPTNSLASLSSTTSSAPTFGADIAGTYTFSLVVNDGQASSTPSSVSVNANVSKELFLAFIAKTCVASPKIYLIDKHIVFVSGTTPCDDVDPFMMFESVPEQQICFGSTFAAPRRCLDSKNNQLFATAIANKTNPTLGLTNNTVELIHP